MSIDTKEFIKKFPLFEHYISYCFSTSQNKPFCILLLKCRLQIVNNPFIDVDSKNKFIEYLNILVRANYIEIKYYDKWIRFLSNKKKAINTFDLEFNKIEETNKNIKNINFLDFKNKKRYIFTQKDLKNVIEHCLFHSWNYDYTPDPLPIRNPYDNRPFTKKELLDLDKQINDPPLVWKLFRESNYCIETLKTNYNYFLLKNCLHSYIASLENEDIIYYLESILMFFKNRTNPNYSNNDICKKCFKNQSYYRQKTVKDVLYKWLQYLKFKIPFTIDNYVRLQKVFKNPCIIHTIFNTNKTKVQLIEKSNNLSCNKDIFVFIATANIKKIKNKKYSVWYKKKKFGHINSLFYTANIFLPKTISIHLEILENEGVISVLLSEKKLNDYRLIKTIE